MTQDQPEAKRYYPSPVEQSILIKNVQAYFQKPERSVERNQIADSVAAQLQTISPHWTHRAVRLWFNNNKHAYMTDAAANVDTPAVPPVAMPPQRATVKFVDPIQVYQPMARMVHPNPPPMMPPMRPAMPPPMANPFPGNWDIADFGKELDQLMERASKCPIQEIPQIAVRFDSVCERMKEKGSAPSHAFATHKVSFPARPDVSPFMEQSDGEGFFISRPPSVGVWQERPHRDTRIAPFDTAFINEGSAAFVHAGVTSERSISYAYSGDAKFGEVWKTQKIPGVRERMDHVVIDNSRGSAWMVSGDHVYRVDLGQGEVKAHTADLKIGPSHYAACPVVMNDSLVLGYSNQQDLFFVDNRMRVRAVRTSYVRECGFSALMAFGQNLLVAMNRSAIIRLLNANGMEAQSFIGHTDTPIMFAPVNERIFVSASDDRSVKIWDSRLSTPVTHITVNNQSITALSASANVVIVSCSDRSVCAFDTRQDPRPLLGVSMDEYGTSNMYYNELDDNLFLFNMATKDGTNDSLLFIDGQGSSSKYLFRTYAHFLRS